MFFSLIVTLLTKLNVMFKRELGFYPHEANLSKFASYFYQNRDPSSLGVIRMMFGLMMLLDVPEERGGATMDMRWGGRRDCHFPLFPAVTALLMPQMALVYVVLWFGALGITLGYRFRMASAAFAAAYWYIFLIEKSFWNNHSYLFGLVALLLSTTQANRYLSIDACNNPSIRDKPVPHWNYFILKYQFVILYFMAGIKKGSEEWLSGYAMRELSKHWVFQPFRLFLSTEYTDYLIVHWFVFLFDLTVAFWMLWSRTRTVAVVFCVAFHLMNSRLFSIGMFPWVCLVTIPLFYPVDWPKQIQGFICHKIKTIKMKYKNIRSTGFKNVNASRNKTHNDTKEKTDNHNVNDENDEQINKLVDMPRSNVLKGDDEIADEAKNDIVNDGRKQKLVTCLIFIYMILQAFLPFSHFITKGYNNWTKGLYGYSWDMMVNSYDTARVSIKLVDNVNSKEYFLEPNAWAPNDRWTRHGDMVFQYAHCINRNILERFEDTSNCRRKVNCIGDSVKRQHSMMDDEKPPNISLYVDVWSSMNSRLHQRMYNPEVDLLQATWSPFSEPAWVMPLLAEYTSWRETAAEMRHRVTSSNNSSGVTAYADFPGYSLENFIEENLDNVTLTVLNGHVIYEPEVDPMNKWSSEEISKRLVTGDSIKILPGLYHKVHTIEKPAAYAYIFTNTAVNATENSELETKDKFPILRELYARMANMFTFFKLIADSFLEMYFGIPMTIRPSKKYQY